MVKELLVLRASLLGVKEEKNRRPQWLGNYIFSNINWETLPIAALSAMQYGWSLEWAIREVVIYNPALGPVNVLKENVSDGFYQICLRPTDAPKIGTVFDYKGEDKELLAIPLTIPMG